MFSGSISICKLTNKQMTAFDISIYSRYKSTTLKRIYLLNDRYAMYSLFNILKRVANLASKTIPFCYVTD